MVALMAQKAEVSYDTCHTTPLEIAAAIQDLGFNATVMQEQEGSKEGLVELHVSQTGWRWCDTVFFSKLFMMGLTIFSPWMGGGVDLEKNFHRCQSALEDKT